MNKVRPRHQGVRRLNLSSFCPCLTMDLPWPDGSPELRWGRFSPNGCSPLGTLPACPDDLAQASPSFGPWWWLVTLEHTLNISGLVPTTRPWRGTNCNGGRGEPIWRQASRARPHIPRRGPKDFGSESEDAVSKHPKLQRADARSNKGPGSGEAREYGGKLDVRAKVNQAVLE